MEPLTVVVIIIAIAVVGFLLSLGSWEIDPETIKAIESTLPLNEIIKTNGNTMIEEYKGRVIARGVIEKVNLVRKERIDDINTYYIRRWYDIIFSDGKIIRGLYDMPSYLEGGTNRIVYYKSGDVISVTYKWSNKFENITSYFLSSSSSH